jgi:hypothetical protein
MRSLAFYQMSFEYVAYRGKFFLIVESDPLPFHFLVYTDSIDNAKAKFGQDFQCEFPVVTTVVATPLFNDKVLEKVADSFYVNFQDNSDSLGRLEQFLKKCIAAWDPSKYLSPYTTLVGPSMIGKSKHMFEIGKRIVSFNICLRQTGAGFPFRSSIATKLLANENNPWKTTIFYVAFICKCLVHLKNQLNSNSLRNLDDFKYEWINSQVPKVADDETEKKFWKDVMDVEMPVFNIIDKIAITNSNTAQIVELL